jgi:hypothetical protein
MGRLIDDIRHTSRIVPPHYLDPLKRRGWSEHVSRILGLVRSEIPVLLIDNVSEYYWTGSGQEHWDLRDHFPNLAPPYGLFWAEHKFPKVIHSDQKGDTDVTAVCPHGRSGWLIMASKREDVTGSGIPDNVAWILGCEHFTDFGIRRDEVQGPDGTLLIAVDAQGRIVETPWMQSYTLPEANHYVQLGMAWVHPVLLSICFLHCKNVTLTDNEVPAKLAKSIGKKHGWKPASWKTLVIEPLKAILRHEGRSHEHGVAKAMHICRGHFKDYREGRGLFGKYHMLVWHDSIVRGTRGEKAPPREIEVKV